MLNPLADRDHRRSRFVNKTAFIVTNPCGSPKLTLHERKALLLRSDALAY